MLHGARGRLSAAMCAGAMAAVVAAGCGGGGDDESTAKDEPVEVSAAGEPAKVFIERMAKLIETAARKEDCPQLEEINSRSATRFPCPAPKGLRKSMASFEVVGVEEYGTGAVVDYKSGEVKDGGAIVLSVAPDRGWGVSRFGVLTPPTTDTSDAATRAGYAKAVDAYLTAVRKRDCDAYFAATFNGSAKKDVVCRERLPGTESLAKALKADPGAKPRYEGGNSAYGFYSLETAKPQPASVTIAVIDSGGGPRSSVVLDVRPSPTAAQQKQAQKEFEKQLKQKPDQDMTPSSKPEPTES